MSVDAAEISRYLDAIRANDQVRASRKVKASDLLSEPSQQSQHDEREPRANNKSLRGVAKRVSVVKSNTIPLNASHLGDPMTTSY